MNNDFLDYIHQLEFSLNQLCLKIALKVLYKPYNTHRWCWFTRNPWNKYGVKYSWVKPHAK